MTTSYYVIDGVNQKFYSVADVKHHIEMYNDADKKSMDGTAIFGFDKKGNELPTKYYHYRKDGKVFLARK